MRGRRAGARSSGSNAASPTTRSNADLQERQRRTVDRRSGLADLDRPHHEVERLGEAVALDEQLGEPAHPGARERVLPEHAPVAAANRMRLDEEPLEDPLRRVADEAVKADRSLLALEDEDAGGGDRLRIDRERFRRCLQELLVVAPVSLGMDSEAAQEGPVVGPCGADFQDGLRDDADRSRRFELLDDRVGWGEALGPEDLAERGGELVGRFFPRGRLVEEVERALRLDERSDRGERGPRLLPEAAEMGGECLVEALAPDGGAGARFFWNAPLAGAAVGAFLL